MRINFRSVGLPVLEMGLRPMASYCQSILIYQVFLLVPKYQPELNRKCKITLGLHPDGLLRLAAMNR